MRGAQDIAPSVEVREQGWWTEYLLSPANDNDPEEPPPAASARPPPAQELVVETLPSALIRAA
jgi:hypothetical protein